MGSGTGGNRNLKNLSKAEEMAIALFDKTKDETLQYKILAEVLAPIEIARQKKDEGNETPTFFKEEQGNG